MSRAAEDTSVHKTAAADGPMSVVRSAGDVVDFGFLVDILRREKWVIFALTLLAVAAAFLFLMSASPTYTSSAQVLLDTRQERITNTQQVVSDLSVSNSIVAGEVELIRSNLLMGQVVDQLDLLNHPAYDPRLETEVGPVAALIDAARELAFGRADPGEELTPEEARNRVISRLQSDIRVSQIGTSYGIRISVDAGSPTTAALIANTVAEQYVENQVAAKRDATLRATNWLEARIEEMSRQLQQAETAVVQFRANMTAELGGDERATAQLLELLNARFIDATIEQSDATVRHDLLSSLFEAGGLDAVADVVTSPLLETLSQQRTELARRHAEMSQTLGTRHPQMIGLQAQMDDLERSMRAEVNRSLEAVRSEMEVAANRRQSLQEEILRIQDRTAQVSAASVQLNQLERTAAAMQLVYDDFLSRFTETTAQIEFQRPDARIISRAEPGGSPTAPRKSMILGTAGIFGLSVGVALAFFKEAMNRSVHSSDALRELTRRPVLALLPYVPHRRRGRRWLLDEIAMDKTSVFKDSIRTLRAKLFQVDSIRRPKVLMVTSSTASEGKSTTSLALANSLPHLRLSTVFVDADLRRSVASQYLRLDPYGGCLTRYLMGEQDRSKLVHHDTDVGIDIVAPLTTSDHAADLISSERFGELIRYLSARYDVVIIDAAPVMDLSDAIVVSTHADATIMVVQSNRVPGSLVRISMQRLNDAGAVVLGTVLTQVRKKDAASREMYSYNNY